MRNPEEYFLEKYSRQIIMEQVGVEGQKKINNSKIKSVILSVSGCKEKEIKKAVLNLKDKNLTLMYGYQNYPTISNKLNISKINKLKRKYKNFEHFF